MGVVYLAWDERLGRKVALKLVPESMVANETELARLKREARTASALNSTNPELSLRDISMSGLFHSMSSLLFEKSQLTTVFLLWHLFLYDRNQSIFLLNNSAEMLLPWELLSVKPPQLT